MTKMLAPYRMTAARREEERRGLPPFSLSPFDPRSPNYRGNIKIGGNTGIENFYEISTVPEVPEIVETDEQIKNRLSERFSIIGGLVDDTINGSLRSLIISGAAGIGKSFTVERGLQEYDSSGDNWHIIGGFSRATGLYRQLYNYRNQGQILVFDDCDSVFFDEVGLNILKKACDTLPIRTISWGAETKMLDADGDPLPTFFEYSGQVIFLTNLDFDGLIEKNNKLTPHLKALRDRSFYIHVPVNSRRDFVIRIQQVCETEGMLDTLGISKEVQKEVIDWIDEHRDTVRDLSLRTAMKLGSLANRNPNWRNIGKVTLLKKGA
jgi:hypothetical protein